MRRHPVSSPPPGHVHRLAGLAVNVLDAAGAHANRGPLASSRGERVGPGGGGRHESAEHLAPRGTAPLLGATALAVLPLENDGEQGELAHGLLVTPEPREGERRDRREGVGAEPGPHRAARLLDDARTHEGVEERGGTPFASMTT